MSTTGRLPSPWFINPKCRSVSTTPRRIVKTVSSWPSFSSSNRQDRPARICRVAAASVVWVVVADVSTAVVVIVVIIVLVVLSWPFCSARCSAHCSVSTRVENDIDHIGPKIGDAAQTSKIGSTGRQNRSFGRQCSDW